MAVLDTGPYFHGTRADLKVGDLLTAGFRSNYDGDVVMNHIYFTAWPKGAGLAAEMAKGDGRRRVYVVEPTGAFEDDPNVTDKKFPGNPTRSYRSREPLRIVGELDTWELFDAEYIRQLRERVRAGMGRSLTNRACQQSSPDPEGALEKGQSPLRTRMPAQPSATVGQLPFAGLSNPLAWTSYTSVQSSMQWSACCDGGSRRCASCFIASEHLGRQRTPSHPAHRRDAGPWQRTSVPRAMD